VKSNLTDKDNVAKYLFIFSLTVTLTGGSYLFGAYSHRKQLFPLPIIKKIFLDLRELVSPSDRILTIDAIEGKETPPGALLQ